MPGPGIRLDTLTMPLSLHDIETLYANLGRLNYGGEAVSQLEHALQCGHLAEQAGDTPAMVCASFLHDLGHLLVEDGAPALPPDQDDLHEYRLLPFLRDQLDPAVLEPIRLHVQAKRYLCAIEPGYFESLSPTSKQTLALQGGVFSTEQAEHFATQPWALDAARLRRYDDLGKVPGMPTPELPHFLGLLSGFMR